MRVTGYDWPYRYWVVDDFLDPNLVRAAWAAVPAFNWDGWVPYMNDCEYFKLTAESWPPGPLDGVMGAMKDAARLVAQLTGVPGLLPTVRCGGLHVTHPGGWLNCHLDAALYPDGRERRANAVLFLNSDWPADGGGAFEAYADDARTAARRVPVAFNRAVVWEASDVAYHGVERTAPYAPPRATAAVYYLAAARPGCVRKRALFVPNRGARP